MVKHRYIIPSSILLKMVRRVLGSHLLRSFVLVDKFTILVQLYGSVKYIIKLGCGFTEPTTECVMVLIDLAVVSAFLTKFVEIADSFGFASTEFLCEHGLPNHVSKCIRDPTSPLCILTL